MRLSRRFVTGLVTAAMLACALAACSGQPGNSSASRVVTWAEPAGSPPNYIFPLDALQYFNTTDINQFQFLMYRPLYWFGDGSHVELNKSLSLAAPPVYSDGNTVVTIALRHYSWSDGKPVTSRDVTFWINLLKANKDDWGEYAPGFFPDDVASVSTPSQTQIVLRLRSPVNPTWFTFNELSQISPLPQHAWDKTSASGPVGNYDQSLAGARQVYKFMNSQATRLSSYASNPLWRIVDGPWRLSQFSASGRAVFVPNRRYSGPVKPRIAKFIEEPFTSEEAEFNALRAGQLTYGYVPLNDISQVSYLRSTGDQIDPWYLWSMSVLPMNFNNAKAGAIFRQVYVRQAMQSLINQPLIIKGILHGYGATDNGPVPTRPATPYVTGATEGNGPFPYSVARARSLLSGHGWTVRPNGVTTCSRPGTGSDDCGAGIAAGARLSFSLLYASGVNYISQEMQVFKSALSQVGIDLSLSEAPANDVYADIPSCKPGQAACSWQMGFWGGGWEFAPDNYPSGEVAFSSDAVGNYGSYNNAEMDRLVKQTTVQAGLPVFHRWVNYTAQQLPMLFVPLVPTQISVIQGALHGAIPEPVDGVSMTPENWYFTR